MWRLAKAFYSQMTFSNLQQIRIFLTIKNSTRFMRSFKQLLLNNQRKSPQRINFLSLMKKKKFKSRRFLMNNLIFMNFHLQRSTKSSCMNLKCSPLRRSRNGKKPLNEDGMICLLRADTRLILR